MKSATHEPDNNPTVRSDEARKGWADLLNQVQWLGRHITIARSGKNAAVVVPVDWYARARQAMGDNR